MDSGESKRSGSSDQREDNFPATPMVQSRIETHRGSHEVPGFESEQIGFTPLIRSMDAAMASHQDAGTAPPVGRQVTSGQVTPEHGSSGKKSPVDPGMMDISTTPPGEGDGLASLSITHMDPDGQGDDDMPMLGQMENRCHDYVQDQMT